MAIVKATYTKSKTGAQASIRYIEQRPGKDSTKISRSLFGIDGVMDRQQAYRLIEQAGKGSIFYRFIISPDPKREDTRRDLHMRGITEQTMLQLNSLLKKEVAWVAAEHADHAPHRHVHVIACVPGKLTVQDFDLLRQTATQASLFQRKERDLARGSKRDRFIQQRTLKSYDAGRQLAGGQRAISVQICPRCGYGQSVGKRKRYRLYRCPLCGLKLISDQRIGLQIKEAKWDRW
jgi:predicted RNA-binding Zn-ribbon protein involved in translation (DUF1610 family)